MCTLEKKRLAKEEILSYGPPDIRFGVSEKTGIYYRVILSDTDLGWNCMIHIPKNHRAYNEYRCFDDTKHIACIGGIVYLTHNEIECVIGFNTDEPEEWVSQDDAEDATKDVIRQII